MVTSQRAARYTLYLDPFGGKIADPEVNKDSRWDIKFCLINVSDDLSVCRNELKTHAGNVSKLPTVATGDRSYVCTLARTDDG